MINRRRFLAISAAMAGSAALIGFKRERFKWRGKAFGSDVSILLYGDQKRAHAALAGLQREIHRLEMIFSLYRPESEISRLNRTGSSSATSRDMRRLLTISRTIWRASNGRFDPTVQKRWRQLASGLSPVAAADFAAVEIADTISLNGHEITLNGIAQGYAGDCLQAKLREYGFDKTLVNMGEYVAGDHAFPIGIENAAGREIGRVALQNAAIATSSANADLVGGQSHILDPRFGAPKWQTISVTAKSGALADGWSTALMLMDEDKLKKLDLEGHKIHLIHGENKDKSMMEIKA